MVLGFANIGSTELLLIVLVILLLFGARRIPEIARALGRATHEFKKAKDDIIDSSKEMMSAAEKEAEKEEREKDNKIVRKK